MYKKVYILFALFSAIGGLCFCALGLSLQSITEIERRPEVHFRAASAPLLQHEDWPCWRGRDFTGVAAGGPRGQAPSSNPPVRWTASENVRWRTPIEGAGHASPIVCGRRVFLAAADESAQTQSVLCLDRSTGAVVWEKILHRNAFIKKHTLNTHASATPACDGQRVYLVFANATAVWASAVDFEGNLLWQTEVGPFYAEWGFGSSPILHQGLVIVAADNKQETLGRFRDTAFLAALDAQSGEIVWRVRRPGQNSYATPVVAKIGGRPQLLLSGRRQVHSYDPSSGKPIWKCPWPAHRTVGAIAFHDDLVFASCGKGLGRQLVCIRATGQGEAQKASWQTHVVWRYTKNTADVPSLVAHENYVYMVSDDGIASCLNAATGKLAWKKRLGGRFFASPILAQNGSGGNLYVANENGETFVFSAGDKFHLQSKNALGEAVYATPAVSGSQLFLRTTQHLYCIEEGETDT